MKTYIKSIIVVLLLFVAFNVVAQEDNKLAINGYKGNYIYNVFNPASVKHPDGEVVGFRLDRKEQREANWQTLYKFSTPARYEELSGSFELAKNKVFEYRPTIAYTVAEVWPVFKKSFNFDSLAPYITQQAMAVAFNVVLIDTSARVNVVYQYKVVQIKKDGNEALSYVTDPISSNDIFVADKPKKSMRKADANVFRLQWRAKMNGKLPEALLVKRSVGLNRPFNRYLIPYTIEQIGDSVIYSLDDEDIKKEEIYQYTITPVNRFGGGAKSVSDTIYSAVIEPYLLTPKIFTVKADSLKNNIVLNWSFMKPDYIGGVSIYRSTDYENNYELIGTTSGFNYIDYAALPGQKYYYYLIVTDRLGRTSDRSPKAYGLMYKTQKSGMPVNVIVANRNKQNVISWTDLNNDTRGYYVYRTNNYGELITISAMIYSDEKAKGLYAFTDTATNLSGKVGYSVVAENTSNIRSNFTSTVYIKNTGVMPVAPTIIDVRNSGNGIHVFWQDMSSNKSIIGYNIYRKKGNVDYVKINKIPMLPYKTSFRDSLILNDQLVEYKMTSVNEGGLESIFSEQKAAQIAQPVYAPTALKAFINRENKIVLQWQPSQSDVAKYEIYRYIRNAEPTKIAEVNGKIVSYTDITFNKEKDNYYFIKTIGLNGNISLPSAETYAGILMN